MMVFYKANIGVCRHRASFWVQILEMLNLFLEVEMNLLSKVLVKLRMYATLNTGWNKDTNTIFPGWPILLMRKLCK